MAELICEHPKIILNPNLGQLIAKYHSYILFGKEYYSPFTYRSIFRLNTKVFYECIDNVSHDNIDDHVVLDKDTGESYPIFLEVPCNHCDLCKNRKINSFVQRCRMESQLYDNYPWFCTLTYNENECPSDGVSVRHCQLFLKRLRINLLRAGHFNPIRYVLVSEYGKHTHRPHYHMIIYNLEPNIWCNYKYLKSIIETSWGYGFIQSRVIDPKDDKAFYYTAKYLRKDCDVPDGCNPTFILSSRKNGGIGAPFIDKIKHSVSLTLNNSFKYLDKWTNKLKEVRFDSYILNRIFPSYCKLIPSDFRLSAQRFVYFYNSFKLTDPDLTFLFDKTYEFVNSFRSNIYLPPCSPNDVAIADLSQDSRTFGILQDCESKLKRYFTQDLDFSKAEKAQSRREKFLNKLFEYAKPIDIATLGYSVRRRFERSKANEIL